MRIKSRAAGSGTLLTGLLAGLVWAAAGSGGSAQSEPPLRVAHETRALHPGEVVLLRIQSALPLAALEARVFDKRFPVFPAVNSPEWLALIGIDLEVSPGTYRVQLTGRGRDGREQRSSYPLRIENKEFPTRRLTVDESFVSPPQDVLERIHREAAATRRIFAHTSPTRHWSGAFLRPVPGEATSSFGSRSILNGQPRSPHSGADFRAAEGTPIRAPNHGEVVLVADHYFSGRSVIVDHGLGLYSYFAHLSRFAVEEGQIVRKGEVVGDVGRTGRVTGPHLHWTVRLMGARVDPVSLMTLSREWGS